MEESFNYDFKSSRRGLLTFKTIEMKYFDLCYADLGFVYGQELNKSFVSPKESKIKEYPVEANKKYTLTSPTNNRSIKTLKKLGLIK